MAAVVSWYGPLIDLAAAASHVGSFVQLLATVRRILHHQERNATTGRTYEKIIVEVGDDTRSSFSVSLWSSKHSSTIIVGDVLLLQNVKIIEFRNGLEGRASHESAFQVLLNLNDLKDSEGIDEVISNCKVGDATRSKIKRVAEWTVHIKYAVKESHHQVISKNWKEVTEMESMDVLSISELLCDSKTCKVNILACISKIVLLGSPTSHQKGHSSVIDKHSLKENNDIVRDFIAAGCKLCGSPLYQKKLRGENTSVIDCPNNPKYLHVPGQIYKPFMIYVCDQSGQVPLLVRNKAAEILFANIAADDVYECYQSHRCMLLETTDSGSSRTSDMVESDSNKEIVKRRKIKQKPNFNFIWLIMVKCLLGKNSPFFFQISVNPEKILEDGRFELISLTMPIP